MKHLEELTKLTESLAKIEEDLREENEILEFILENTTDGYWDWDIQKNTEYLSSKFKAQLGFEKEEMENTPEAWMVLCNKEDLERVGLEIEKILKGDKDEFSETLLFTHKLGHSIKILCRGKLVTRLADGTPIRMIGTHTIIPNT